MPEIPVSKGRAFATIDAADFMLVEDHKWWLDRHGYAWTRIDGKRVAMHRLILGLTPNDPRHTDHVNRDRLDNRRANLRAVTQGENNQNCVARNSKNPKPQSRYRGVMWHTKGKKWQARVAHNGEVHYLGLFTDELEAARAAEAKRQEVFTHAEPDPALA